MGKNAESLIERLGLFVCDDEVPMVIKLRHCGGNAVIEDSD